MNEKYKVFYFDYIKENQSEIISEATTCYNSLIADGFGDTTWSYYLYNIFSVSSPSIHFWNIFKYVRDIIKDNVPDERMWFQAWLNYHDHSNVLGWHNHSAPYHGYICIEPQDTITDFGDWEIENKSGNIYFGSGGIKHRVVNKSFYTGKRITIGFDLIPESCFDKYYPTKQYGAMPLL